MHGCTTSLSHRTPLLSPFPSQLDLLSRLVPTLVTTWGQWPLPILSADRAQEVCVLSKSAAPLYPPRRHAGSPLAFPLSDTARVTPNGHRARRRWHGHGGHLTLPRWWPWTTKRARPEGSRVSATSTPPSLPISLHATVVDMPRFSVERLAGDAAASVSFHPGRGRRTLASKRRHLHADTLHAAHLTQSAAAARSFSSPDLAHRTPAVSV
jgi:hypothetical protein